jgi:hypothetical protein
MIKLSILVPTVPSRIEFFYVKLMKELLRQIEPYKNEIELISLFDNKKRSIGKKRQEMINLSQGEYIVFIDDDDRISDDYVSQIMKKLYENPNTDCVVFDSIYRINGGIDKLCKFGIEFEYGDVNGGLEFRRKPAHIMVYSSSIVKRHQYNDMGNGEDSNWIERAHLDIKNQTRIDKVLYYYDAEYATTSETAGLTDEIILENVNKKLLNNIEYFITNTTNLLKLQKEFLKLDNRKLHLIIDKKSFNDDINTFLKCIKKGYCYKNSNIKLPESLHFKIIFK